MANQNSTPETDTTTGGDAEASRIASIDDLVAKVDRLAELVARVIPGSHAEAEQRTEDRLDRPTDVSEQVRAELARAREAEAAEQAAAREREEHENLKATVARLAETRPQPPVRRATRVMWGGR